MQSRRENGSVLLLQVDAYSTYLWTCDKVDEIDLFQRNMSLRIYRFQSRAIKTVSTRIKYYNYLAMDQ